jgi:NAD(P)-dependent dehydrogenase (short-subunit alcohol dehydrogenase family)
LSGEAAEQVSSQAKQHHSEHYQQTSLELLDYATTKAGIVNFTQCLTRILANKGIR